MRTMLAEGVEYFVEIGPGHTLSTLLKKNKCRGKDLYGFYHGGSCKNAGFSERNGIKGEKIEK